MTTSFSEAISRAPLKAFSIATFVICMVVLIADGMDAQLLGIVAPLVREEFNVDGATFGIAMSAALIGFGIGSWGGGWLGDTIGRRWSLAIATVIFSLATIGASTAGDVWQMAGWRIVSGVGFGSAYANAIALAGEWLPDRWRSVGVTTLSVGTPAGGVVVGLLAPTLLELYGWRGTFVAMGVATLVVVILIIAVLRDSPTFLLAKGKPEEAKLAAGKVLDEELELTPERHLSDREGVSIGVFDSSNFRLNLGIGIAFAAATLIAYGMLSWATTFLTVKGFTLAQGSYTVAVGGMAAMAGSVAVGVLIQFFGSRNVVIAVTLGLLATLIAHAMHLESIAGTPTTFDFGLVLVLYSLAGALFSAAIASFYAMMTYGYPSSCRSAGIGFGIFVGRAGAISATGLGGWLIDLGDGNLMPFFAVLCVSSLAILSAAFIVDRQVPAASKA
jgi:AAHS family 4-hydroxybenzoate transporter-like MFS transporter